MSKICRTCLQRTNTVFKTSDTLGNFGQGSIRISVVLRFCIPELYLGLSSNPEICFTCKENLKMSYLFKRKCLDTESTIGNYLKNVRCTAKSIDLHDVLAYVDDTNVNKPTLNVTPALNKLENGHESETVNNESLQAKEQAPVPIATNGCLINLTDAQNLIFSQINLLNLAQKVDNPTINTQPQFIVTQTNKNATQKIDNPVMNAQPQFIVTQTNENATLQNKSDDNSLCKISGVYSLNTEVQENPIKNNFESTNLNEATNTHTETNDIFEIKDEPLDIDLNDNFNYPESDEETLDASETASVKNSCSPSLQEFIDSIPEVNNPDQYVDVPDFVTINNFGFKELEEFKLQQVVEQNDLKAEEKPPEITINSANLNKVAEGAKSEMKVVKVLAMAPDVIIVNGKRMIKCGNQYKLEKSPETGEIVNPPVAQGVQAKSVITPVRKRNRKKIKIVPVSDQPVEKKIKLDNPIIKLPKTEDKDVVVLFTNYTSDGYYINDHDYLISPYRRNKVLIEENAQWLCMCFICNSKHPVYEHLGHMKSHGTRCTLCDIDLGTPYVLNIHSKGHRKACKYCTQVLPLGAIKRHEEEHIAEENDILEKSPERAYSMRKGKRKANKDEKPVYFRYTFKQEAADDANKCGGSVSDSNLKTVIPDVKEEPRIDNSELSEPVMKKRGRPRKKYAFECATEGIDGPRTLRTRVKRWYVESDDEGETKKRALSESKGTISDPKEEEN